MCDPRPLRLFVNSLAMVTELQRRPSLPRSRGRSRDRPSRVAVSPEEEAVPLVKARRDPPAAATPPGDKGPSKTPAVVKRKKEKDKTPRVSPKSEEEPPEGTKSPPRPPRR